jgi:hypothetical protein
MDAISMPRFILQALIKGGSPPTAATAMDPNAGIGYPTLKNILG